MDDISKTLREILESASGSGIIDIIWGPASDFEDFEYEESK